MLAETQVFFFNLALQFTTEYIYNHELYPELTCIEFRRTSFDCNHPESIYNVIIDISRNLYFKI